MKSIIRVSFDTSTALDSFEYVISGVDDGCVFYGFNIVYSIAYGSLDMIKKCIDLWMTERDEDIDPDLPIEDLVKFATTKSRSYDIIEYLTTMLNSKTLGHMKHGDDYEMSNDDFIGEWTTHKLWLDEWTAREIFELVNEDKKSIRHRKFAQTYYELKRSSPEFSVMSVKEKRLKIKSVMKQSAK